MSKKFLTTGIIAIILLFFSTAFCYATENKGNTQSNNNVNLGDELTNSMNKVEKTAGNVKNRVTDGNMIDGMKEGYNAKRTSVNDTIQNTTGMSGTTWIWIILAVTGIVILATVWFYAMQNSSND